MKYAKALTLLLCLAGLAQAEEKKEEKLDAAGVEFFEKKIRPVLSEHCYGCHSGKAGKSEGSLLLDSKHGIQTGGDRGPAIVPGKVQESLLLTAISHTDPDFQMPPKKGRLPDAVLADFKRWVEMGAPDPREFAEVAASTVDLEAGRRFWAFQKPTTHPLPKTSNPQWATRDLDHFILQKLDQAKLKPTPDAAPVTLLRRLHFDLVGLPPSTDDITVFVKRVAADGYQPALEAEVDRLLASPRSGERWGRHWLDVARFAESSGKESNVTFAHAWRYRNYILDAFIQDMPYDRLLQEQIAGDLLPYDSDAQRERQLIATGFLAIGPVSLNEMNKFQLLADIADEQIDTLSRSVMGYTVACARCHDHKFDPFTMEDYYSLAGMFISPKTHYGTSVAPDNQHGGDYLVLPKLPGQHIPNKPIPAARVKQMKEQVAKLQQELKDGQEAARKAVAEGRQPFEVFTLQRALAIIWSVGGMEGQLKTVDDEGHPLPLAMGVLDREKIFDAPLLARGEISRPGKKIPRGFPQVITLKDPPQIPSAHSGRLELAQWLTHPDHPLTSRVMANRVWHYLLGAGIVRTVDNFGTHGERPSHPELLDHLAVKFVQQKWSVKSLIREIVLSRTYRQASTFNPAAFEQDPDNRLLWRANKRRLDAESIRDGMLFVSGELDYSRPAGSLVAELGERQVAVFGFIPQAPPDLDGSLHRSIYLPVLRDRLPDVLDLFDFAEPSLVTGARETTNVPLQALYLMNSPFVTARSQALATRVLSTPGDLDTLIHRSFLLTPCRPPDPSEHRWATQFFQKFSPSPPPTPAALTAFCQALLSTAEFRNLD